jgi:hypothetical protein
MSRLLNVWVILLNFALALAAVVSLSGSAFDYTATISTICLVMLVVVYTVLRWIDRKHISGRVLAALWGTSLVWIPVFDAPGFGERPILRMLIDGSIILGCVLLISSAVWPRKWEDSESAHLPRS